MSKGMLLPVRVNKRGGAALTEASPYTEQVISAGLTPNLSKNPFQAGGGVEIGISERFVFANNTPGAQAGARRQIVRFFARIRQQEIARLVSGRNGLSFRRENEELIADVNYLDLEADEERSLTSNLKDALRSEPRVNASGM